MYRPQFSDRERRRRSRLTQIIHAARFLRGKWDSNTKDIKTANDFIDKVGAASSTTGKDYLIRSKDGRETKSREFLRAELKKIETKK